MKARALVDKLLETDPDEVDPKHFLRTAWPQRRMRYLSGERVTYTKRGLPIYKATVVNSSNNPDYVWIHADGYEPHDDFYVHADELEPLIESRCF
jgi:hypothetical protein